jgi:phosphatidylglycerophosphate synthase
MLDQHRNWFKGLENKTADVFAVLPLTPNQYTSLSLIAALAMAYFMLAGNYLASLGLFIVAAPLDFIDGAVARRKGLSTAQGAYWDTIADRYVEAIFLFGLMFAGLPDLFLPASVWIFILLVGAMMTTYAKAAAKEKSLSDAELKGGLMSRGERFIAYGIILMLLIGSIDQWAIIVIAMLSFLSNLTAIQRISLALRKK